MMLRNSGIWTTLVLGLTIGCKETVLIGTGDESKEAAPGASAAQQKMQSPQGPLTLVTDRSLVCMVNDQFMGRPQIPVVVNGATYYGCCPACKERLTNEPGTRSALDPGNHRPIDKAHATIAQTESGAALYFESKESLVAYSQAASTR